MKIACEHGYYKFYPETPDHLMFLEKVKGLKLVAEADYFTFEPLKSLDSYTIFGKPYGLLPALKTYSGTKAECLKQNKMVYNLKLKKIIYMLPNFVSDAGSIVSGIPQVGFCLTSSGKIVTGFVGNYIVNKDVINIIKWEELS